MSATLADYSAFDDVDQYLDDQWPVMARCVQALTCYFQAKITTGTEPLDVLNGISFGIDGQSTTVKDWRVFVDSANGFLIQENTGTDAVPVWVSRLELPLGGGLVSAHATSHQHGGTDEVGTATPGANAILKADSSGQIAAGWLTGVVRNAEVASAAGIVYSKLNLTGSIVDADIGASAAIARTKLLAMNASRAAVSDASGFLATSAVTSTELGFLSGVTSAVQTQLGTKLSLSGGVMSGTLDMDGNDIILDSAGTVLLGEDGGSVPFRVSVTGTGNLFRVVSGGFYDFFEHDSTANAGPAFRSFRVSASPAANDDIGVLDFYGKDTANADTLYAELLARIDDPTDGSEDGHLRVNIRVAGATTNVAQFQPEGLRLPIQTASRACVFDANKAVISATATAAEVDFLSGVTSAIQTQLGTRPVLLATYTPAAAASLDITSVFSGTYSRYWITAEFSPVTDDVELHMRTDTSNGASFDSGGTDYRYAYSSLNSAGSTFTNNGASGEMRLGSLTATQAVGNVAGEGIAFSCVLFTGSAARFPSLSGTGFIYPASGTGAPFYFGGTRQSAATITAIQFYFESGNIASGIVKVYGLP